MKKRCRRSFVMLEALVSLGVLIVLVVMMGMFEARLARFETRSVRQAMAVMAAESQCERVRAGLGVLDENTFADRYPGLVMTFREESRGEGFGKKKVGVVTVAAKNEHVPVKVELVVAMEGGMLR